MALLMKTIVQTPTITAGAYSAQDAVGGLLTFADAGPNALSGGGNSGVYVDAAVLTDLAKQDIQLDLFLFSKVMTPVADNAAFDVSDTDILNCVGVISFTSYFDSNDSSVCAVRGLNMPVLIENTAGALYGQMVTRGAPTYAGTSDIQVRLTILKG